MMKVLEGPFGGHGAGELSTDLDAPAREGARRMLIEALEAEVAEYIAKTGPSPPRRHRTP